MKSFQISYSGLQWSEAKYCIRVAKPSFNLQHINSLNNLFCLVLSSNEPKMGPPLHGYQVAEPHVGQLVTDHHQHPVASCLGRVGVVDQQGGFPGDREKQFLTVKLNFVLFNSLISKIWSLINLFLTLFQFRKKYFYI